MSQCFINVWVVNCPNYISNQVCFVTLTVRLLSFLLPVVPDNLDRLCHCPLWGESTNKPWVLMKCDRWPCECPFLALALFFSHFTREDEE